jgi:hypothetical protein
MKKNIKLKASVFEKNQYKNNIDTLFSQLTSSLTTTTSTPSLSIPEFFDKYNTLFFDIPRSGSSNISVLPSGSHSLIASSSLNPLSLNFNPVNDPTIQDLLQQVNDIREEILSLNLQILLISDPEYVALNPDAAETGSASSAFSTISQYNSGTQTTQQSNNG